MGARAAELGRETGEIFANFDEVCVKLENKYFDRFGQKNQKQI